MISGPTYKARYEAKLILLAATALTLLFMLPRLAVLRQAGSMNRDMVAWSADFWLKTFYSFVLAVGFLYANMRFTTLRAGMFKLNTERLADRLILNALGFLIIRAALLQLHILILDPVFNGRLFRVFFNISLGLEVLLIVLIVHIYQLVYKNQQLHADYSALRKAHAEARLEALKNQLRPHFLFNSFSSLKGLISTDQQAAVCFLDNLSDVLRYSLVTVNAEAVPLADELRLATAYAELLKIRHGDRILIEQVVDPDAGRYYIPPMALQTLLENAVKHNSASSKDPLQIRVYTKAGRLVVENSLRPRRHAEPSTGLGLVNLGERCRYLSNEELVVRRTATAFFVSVPLTEHHECIDYRR